MHDIIDFFELVTILGFVLGVIWLGHTYRGHKAKTAQLVKLEDAGLTDLMNIANRMEQRLGTLESILDAEDPKWKERA
jgi:phage shock protein B